MAPSQTTRIKTMQLELAFYERRATRAYIRRRTSP